MDSFLNFRRASVADQAAAGLREGIVRGIWGQLLPGEYALARQLGIGRSSVRAALAQLADEGLIGKGKGRRARILRHRHRPSANPTRTVSLISPNSRKLFDIGENPIFLEVHVKLADQGIAWEEVSDSALSGKGLGQRLKTLVSGRHGVCWLLSHAPAAVQRWFEKENLPAILVGHCFSGVELPSVDMDYYAVGWHAAGRMVKYGHRHIAMIFPTPLFAGDIACRRGFLDYTSRNRASLLVTELTAGMSRSGFLTRLGRLLGGHDRPTAILSMTPNEALTAYIHILRSGLAVPRDISMISADSNALLEKAVPELTRYRVPAKKVATRVVRLTQALLTGLPVPAKPNLIVPTFISGSTLARGPA
jgi:hypothetical protein